MKIPHIRSSREFILVGGVTLLALIPLFLLWRKSAVTPPPQFAVTPAPGPTLKPVVARMGTGQSFVSSRATISPDARWLARMEIPAPIPGATPTAQSSNANELVIRSTRNGKEAFRAFGVGNFVGWISNSAAFVAQDANMVHVFAPSPVKPGAPPPSQPWTQTTVTFASHDPDAGAAGFGGGNDSDLYMGDIVFSPDFRFVVKAYWGQGTIEWQAVDLTTKTVFPPVTTGRWIGYDPHVGGASDKISVAVAPASLTTGKLPVVAVWQTLEPIFHSVPTPTPSPVPTPKATPTYSPAQVKFKAEESRENAQIQTLVEKVLGVDGSDPEVTDPDEVARITSEVKRRNHALDLERERVFPGLGTPRLTPTPQSPRWDLTEPFQIETFDLNTRKRVWVSKVQADIFPPQMKFSPDGSALVAWGTAAQREDNGRSEVDGVGIEFRSARTGRLTGKAHLYEDQFGIPSEGRLESYDDVPATANGVPRSIFVVKDSYQGMKTPGGKFEPYQQGTVLRFFSASSGRELGYLKTDTTFLPTDQQELPAFSISQNGSTWLWGESDIFMLPRRDLGQERNGALPAPTPDPHLVKPKHVSGR